MRLSPGSVSWRRAAVALVAVAGVVAAAGAFEARRLLLRPRDEVEADRRARLKAAGERFSRLSRSLIAAADRAAALPEARAALRGERNALPGLFRSLEAIGSGHDAPAVAIHALPFSKVAWARPTADLLGLEPRLGVTRGLHALVGSVTTMLLASSEVRATDGGALGMATAETAVRVHRNISNEYLHDFDRIEGEDTLLEVDYADNPAEAEALGLKEGSDCLVLRGPDGVAIAAVWAREPSADVVTSLALARYRRIVTALLVAALLAAAFSATPTLARLAVLATGGWTAVALLGPPWPFPAASPAALPTGGPMGLAPLLSAPGASLMTAFWALLLAAWLSRFLLRHSPAHPSLLGSALSGLLSLPLLGAAFALIGQAVARSPYDLAAVSLLPRSASHLASQVALLLLLAAALLVLVGLLSYGGPLPQSPRGRLERSLLWAVLGVGAHLVWPRNLIGLPLVPAVLLLLLAALLAGTQGQWMRAVSVSSAGTRAGMALVAVAGLSLLLYPTLVHFGEKAQRRRIEGEYAELIRRQQVWRGDRLREAERQIDELQVLEETTTGRPPGQEELAFSIWSAAGLSGAGVASAVEVQDRSGTVISRFALDLRALLATAPPRNLPREDAWTVTEERLTLASDERHVLHARRRLVYHGEVHGAVHLYLGDDAWDLPFLPQRDPIGALYRSGPGVPAREEALDLTVYAPATRVVFTSAERVPSLTPPLLERLRQSPEGLWTTLPVDGRPHHTYLIAQGPAFYAVSYPRPLAGAFLAGLAEAVAGFGSVALAVIVAVLLVRSLLGRESLSLGSFLAAIRGRFALRLFVSFVAAAVLPVAFLEVAFRGYVAERLRRESEDQALERAEVAQRAVDDISFYQRGEGPDRAAVTDTALVWVAGLIRGDVDVFGRGRLLASSKRELFSSGLLPETVPGPVFRALTLEGAPSLLRTERIGGFSALVAYVPVRLGAVEPGILALPLAVKEREARATLEDFDRSMRLASLAFLALAAGLALSLSRRISGPIRDLTQATRRIAGGDLRTRVATVSRDELKNLVDSFNQMASDLERQRRDLERSNRLAAWAEMARQVAHEVKNPLTPIQLSTEHLQRVWRDGAADFGATLEACTDTILRQVRTLRGIVTEFSAFARPPAPEPEEVDLGRLVEEAVRPYRNALPPGVALDVEVGTALPNLRLDRRLVARAVVNLLENALQAVGDGGRIVVRVGASNGDLEVEVEDDGPGLAPDSLARAFEPFFSTKSHGSGLGLALVRRVAEDHGGSATLTSTLGQGTQARIRLPLSVQPQSDRGPAQ
jgi:signal transduction histidine kinase